MAILFPPENLDAVIFSIQKYMNEEFDQEISGMKAKFLLDYFLREIGPFPYNQGVKDAEEYFRGKLEDLSGTCFEDGLNYWKKRA